MLVYLIRHGEAERPGPDKPKALTTRGQAEVTRLAEELAQKKVKVDSLWHSPKKRAVQTADILQKTLGLAPKILRENEELKPGGDAEEIYCQILAQNIGHLMIVSHLPFLPDLAALLMAKQKENRVPAFPTAGLSVFEGDKTFKCLWSLSPGDLR